MSSRKLAGLVEVTAFVGNAAPARVGHKGTQFASASRLVGDLRRTETVQSKEEGASLCRQAAPPRSWRSDRQRVCIRLALMNSRKLARLVGDLSRLQLKAKRKAAAFVGKQRLRVPDRQANSLHPPRTEEQPQACSIGLRSLTAPEHSKEEGGSLCWHASPVSKCWPQS